MQNVTNVAEESNRVLRGLMLQLVADVAEIDKVEKFYQWDTKMQQIIALWGVLGIVAEEETIATFCNEIARLDIMRDLETYGEDDD